MKYTTVFFSNVGGCPWWCCDTDECGHPDAGDESQHRCLLSECNGNAPIPSRCPCKDSPFNYNTIGTVPKDNKEYSSNNRTDAELFSVNKPRKSF
jgi:hypothetical protein